ncbi:MAG: pilus assembly protein [Planctomycetia bacterium]|nr:pilus assembly protein [Planctomycetia bacterium]
MNPFTEIFRSVEVVWLLWLLSIVGAGWCWRAIARCPVRRSPRELVACEAGVSYTLGFVITIPIFALLICLVVDLSLILVTKIGTMYAAYAAARSAVVWAPSGVGSDVVEAKARLAAVQAMTPFASGTAAHAPQIAVPPEAAEFVAAYRAYAANPLNDAYLTSKYRYAAWASSLEVAGGKVPADNLRLTLDYRAPFHLPGIGRLLGARQSADGPFVMSVRSVVELESHAPHGPSAAGGTTTNAARPLGISYVPQAD